MGSGPWPAGRRTEDRGASVLSMGVRLPLPLRSNHKAMKKTIMTFFAVAALASCSVKEDRTPCPCWLTVDLDGCLEHSTDVTVAAWNGRNIYTEDISASDYSDGYEKPVPKGQVISTALCGLQRSSYGSGRITIPYGEQSDPVRVHRSLLECTGEFARDTAVLNKQYANVYLKIEAQEGGDYPYSLVVESDVDGIDTRTLQPTSGAFMHPLVPSPDRTCQLRLPRQRDDSRPVIVVYDQGAEADRLPLWEWIRKTGYSWRDRDLKDIYIGVDYVRAEVSITIQGWEDGESMNIIL